MKYDTTLRTSLKRTDSVADALGSETIKPLIDDIARKSADERGEVLDTASHIVPAESDTPDDSHYLIALQSGSLRSLTVDHLVKMEHDDADTIKEHQDLAVRHLQMGVRLIDGSLPDKEIILAFQKVDAGIGNLLIFYDVKASGEDSKRPESRKPMLRKVHLERSVKMALRSRNQDPDVYHLLDSDIFVFLDAGRHGNTGSLTGSLKDDADKAITVLNNVWQSFNVHCSLLFVCPSIVAVPRLSQSKLGSVPSSTRSRPSPPTVSWCAAS